MSSSSSITVARIVDSVDRAAALRVVSEVYLAEKRWIANVDSEIPEQPQTEAGRSWFLARVGDEPVGVIRLVYDPSLELPPELDVALEPGVDLESIAARGRFVEIGRFMISPRHRSNTRIALRLMQEASAEVIARGYSHFLTDVFVDDAHSPLRFHTRVLGFERIATHRFGELACDSLRVVLILDIARAYNRLRDRRNRVFRLLGQGLDESRLLTAGAAS
jgi:Acetyltransferase (GNAT) family